mgnify:CR=1 FL=1
MWKNEVMMRSVRAGELAAQPVGAVLAFDDDAARPVQRDRDRIEPVSYTHLTLPTSDLV